MTTIFDEYVLVKAATFAKNQKIKFDSEYSLESMESSKDEESKSARNTGKSNEEKSKQPRSSMGGEKIQNEVDPQDRVRYFYKASGRNNQVPLNEEMKYPYGVLGKGNTMRTNQRNNSIEFNRGSFSYRVMSLRKNEKDGKYDSFHFLI